MLTPLRLAQLMPIPDAEVVSVTQSGEREWTVVVAYRGDRIRGVFGFDADGQLVRDETEWA